MNGVLPDASVWIDYFNPRAATPEKSKLITLFENNEQPYICPAIFQEVLQGIRDDTKLQRDKRQLLKCKHGKVSVNQATNQAIEIYRSLRKRGITIRKPNDCLIAAYAILGNLAVLHNDRDFDPIEQYFGLKVVR
jgi:predicted nucleic acid-binding protein